MNTTHNTVKLASGAQHPGSTLLVHVGATVDAVPVRQASFGMSALQKVVCMTSAAGYVTRPVMSHRLSGPT